VRGYRLIGLTVVAGVVTALAAAALAVGPRTEAVTQSVIVTAGPNAGSTSHAADGDRIRWDHVIDPEDASDPRLETVVHLTGSHVLDGEATTGTGLSGSYSADGTTFVTGKPDDPTRMRYLRFSGRLATGGPGAAAPAAVQGAQTLAGSAGGDGYVPILTGTRVFNIFHHSPARLACHVIETGRACPGYPFGLTIGGTAPTVGQSPVGFIDPPTNHLWVAAQRDDAGHQTDLGFLCFDIGTDGASPASCGWVAAGTATATGPSRLHSGGNIGRKLYAIDTTGKVYCLDAAASSGAGAACTGYPVSTGLPTADDPNMGVSLSPIGNSTKMIARTNVFDGGPNLASKVTCFDTATDARCAGWAAGAPGVRTIPNTAPDGDHDYVLHSDVLPVQTNGTTWDAFCATPNGPFASATLTVLCYTLADGGTVPAPPGLAATPGDATGWVYGNGNSRSTTHGHKVYFVLTKSFNRGDRFVCYDYAAGGVCPNYPFTRPAEPLATYGVTVDPAGTCLWALGDAGAFGVGSTADFSQPCAGAGASATVRAAPEGAYCGGSGAGANWDKVTVRGLTRGTDYASARVTVLNDKGVPVTGFNDIALPMSQAVDISSLAIAGATSRLKARVAFEGLSAAAVADDIGTLQITWSGAPVHICFHTEAVTSCSAIQDITATTVSAITDAGAPAMPVTLTNTLTRTDPAPAGCAGAGGTLAVTGRSTGAMTLVGVVLAVAGLVIVGATHRWRRGWPGRSPFE
jgi:hypothetical protein